MKKFAIASVLALAAISASALEVGVTGTRDYAGANRNGAGITVGTQVAGFGLTAGFERTQVGEDQNRLSLVADKKVATLGPVDLTVRAGVAHLDNQTSKDGYALTAGVGASYSLTKATALTLAVDRQYGQDRVSQFDGNRVTVGIKTGF